METMLHFSFYFLDAVMPPAISAHIDKVRTENPGFQVKVWGPDETRSLLRDKYPQLLDKFDGLPYAIQKSDFSRYVILHAEGGLYMDLDYHLTGTLAAVFQYLQDRPEGAFVNETPNAVLLRRLSNSFMAAKAPGHPFWLHVLQAASGGRPGLSKHERVMTGTGPKLIDAAYRSYSRTAAGKAQPVGVLPKALFNPCSICSRGNSCASRPGVLAYHANAGSWNTGNSVVYNWLYCNLGWVVAVCLLVVLVVVLAVLLAVKCSSKSRLEGLAEGRGRDQGLGKR